MEPNETEICLRVETKITDEERLIIDAQKQKSFYLSRK